MYYAKLWFNYNNHSVRQDVAGWTIHESLQRAADLTEIHIPKAFCGRIYMVEVKLPDFDKELFKAIMKQGYYFTDEAEPIWLVGTAATTSKLA